MVRSRFKKSVVGLACLALIATMTTLTQAELTKNQIKILETEFLPAWHSANHLGVLESMNKAVRRMNAEQLAELDSLLLKQDIPVSAQVLLEARLHLLRLNHGQKLPLPRLRELMMTMEYSSGEIGNRLNESVELLNSMKQTTIGDTFETIDELLRKKEILNYQLDSAIFIGQYVVETVKKSQRFDLSSLNEEQKELFESDFSVQVEELVGARTQLAEHEIVVRINRLKHAVKVLADNSADRKEQFLAAWAVNQDVANIRHRLEAAGDEKFSVAELNDENLVANVESIAAQGISLAGEELLTKSRLLFEGMQWWYRGRYGMGSDAMGMLKSPEAATSDEAAFALFLPNETPIATSTRGQSANSVPVIDRRHKYIWAWEYREVYAGTNRDTSRELINQSIEVNVSDATGQYFCGSSLNTLITETTTDTIHGTQVTIHQLTLSDIDDSLVRRAVGYVEYGNALASFGSLVEMSDGADLDAIDAIIGDRQEFSVFPDLPESFRSSSSEQTADPSTSRETGLAWLVALARVEYGALIAGHTRHPDPYEFFGPDAYAYKETMNLLLEGAASHYLALKDKEAFSNFMEENNSVQGALTVSRRVRLALSMLRPLLQPERSAYSSQQVAQLETASRDLNAAQASADSVIKDLLDTTFTRIDERVFTETTTRTRYAFLTEAQREATRAALNPTPSVSPTPQGSGNRN